MRLYLRRATIEDSFFLWRLRNQKEVRKNSFNTRKVSYPEHRKWLINKLSCGKSFLYIIAGGGRSIGQVRFDIRGEGSFVNISISRRFRNGGYGTRALKRASERFMKAQNPKYITAYVKEDNTSSLECFRKAGYLHKAKRIVNGCRCRALQYRRRRKDEILHEVCSA